jgi:hypothetical protein
MSRVSSAGVEAELTAIFDTYRPMLVRLRLTYDSGNMDVNCNG